MASANPDSQFGAATRSVLLWQLGSSAICAAGIWAAFGRQAALSSAIGGGIICIAFGVFGVIAQMGIRAAALKKSTGLWAILRAEIIKLALIIGLTVWVMRSSSELELPAMFGTFLLVMMVGRFVMLKNAQKY